MLTTSEISAMRAAVAESLTVSAQIQRKTLATDSAGGYTESWSVQATVNCRIAPAGTSPSERVIAERVSAVAPWMITLPASTDVRPDDRIVAGGRVYQVVSVLAGTFEVARRVLCSEVI